MDSRSARQGVKMKSAFASFVVCLLATSASFSQSSNWRSVQEIVSGTRISVKTRFRSLCEFSQATTDTLTCLPAHPSPIVGRRALRFERSKVREVRLEHSDAANLLIGGAVGAGTGAAIGTAVGDRGYTKEGRALLLGAIGGLIGGSLGREFPIRHGKKVYRRP